MADGQRAHRTLLLKAPIRLRAPNIWYMPHEFPGVFQALLHHGRGLGHTDLEEAAVAVSRRPLGSCWFRPDKVKASILPQRDCRTRALSLQFPLQLVLRGPASGTPGFQRPAD